MKCILMKRFHGFNRKLLGCSDGVVYDVLYMKNIKGRKWTYYQLTSRSLT